MSSFINRHNRKILNRHTRQTNVSNTENTRQYNCRQPNKCPAEGKCLTKIVVYQAEVTADNDKPVKYIGVTTDDFKTRFRNHAKSLANKKLSGVWKGMVEKTGTGYRIDGYRIDGYRIDGYRIDGYRIDGYRIDGYRIDGYRIDGYRIDGYRIDGYRIDGYRIDGYRINGYRIDGYRIDGYRIDGYRIDGYHYTRNLELIRKTAIFSTCLGA